MNHQYYNVIGIMSGTSLDGIDLVHVSLKYTDAWSFEILQSDCIPYSLHWKKRLQEGISLEDRHLKDLNIEYTQLLAGVCNEFIERHAIRNLLAICSHGHTISHEPERGHTLQIGNLPALATLTNRLTVCDFRTQDVALGGQGAPLVPIGDRLLFSNYQYCLNLGGFANVSFEQEDKRIAYDICAVNVVLNHYAQLLGKEFDDNGAFAKAGTIHTAVLQRLNDVTFYELAAPKSLGIEWVDKHIFTLLESVKDPMDAIATYTQHIATQIGKNLPLDATVIATGGGTYNSHLLTLINANRTKKICVPDSKTIEYKEAVIFALLGVLKLRNANNCLKSVTGASRDHSSGEIYVP